MVLAIGLAVATIEEVPIVLGDLLALKFDEGHACVVHSTALLLDFLALVALHAGEKLREVCVRLGLALHPMELHGAAHHPALVASGLLILFVEKQQVRG